MTRGSALLLIGLAGSLALPARGEVVDVGPSGFLVRHEVTIQAPPDKVYEAFTQKVSGWWSSAHTYSHDATNLSIDARAGGCFCEKLPNGGSVQHLTVAYAAPGQAFRMTGGLGPMQGSGIAGSLSLTLAPKGGSTVAVWTYSAGGYMQGGFEKMAPAADGMLLEQLTRFKTYVETGSPVPKAAPAR